MYWIQPQHKELLYCITTEFEHCRLEIWQVQLTSTIEDNNSYCHRTFQSWIFSKVFFLTLQLLACVRTWQDKQPVVKCSLQLLWSRHHHFRKSHKDQTKEFSVSMFGYIRKLFAIQSVRPRKYHHSSSFPEFQVFTSCEFLILLKVRTQYGYTLQQWYWEFIIVKMKSMMKPCLFIFCFYSAIYSIQWNLYYW